MSEAGHERGRGRMRAIPTSSLKGDLSQDLGLALLSSIVLYGEYLYILCLLRSRTFRVTRLP